MKFTALNALSYSVGFSSWKSRYHCRLPKNDPGSLLSPASQHPGADLSVYSLPSDSRATLWSFCVPQRLFFRVTGSVFLSNHRKLNKEKVKGHREGQNGLNLVNIRGYSF